MISYWSSSCFLNRALDSAAHQHPSMLQHPQNDHLGCMLQESSLLAILLLWCVFRIKVALFGKFQISSPKLTDKS